MLTLRSFLRNADEVTKSKITLTLCKGAATGLFLGGVILAHPDIQVLSAGGQVLEVSKMTAGTDSGEESDTKAKVQSSFEDLTVSVEMLSKNSVSENLNVEAEPFVETKEVISTKVQETATETVKAANLLSQDDYDVLLKIVEAEAGGEDLKGKILVANVVMNRVNSGRFPNSVRSVVYQNRQFSPVIDGRINRVTVSEQTIEAVTSALCGEDYSQGAFYFSARDKADKSSMRWFDRSLKWMFKHGDHEFYTFR